LAARVIVAIEEDVVPAYDLPSNKIKAGKAPQGFISENERRISIVRRKYTLKKNEETTGSTGCV
jgi:hypothetical protein